MNDELTVKCPVCGSDFNLEEELEENDIINCSVCDAELEVLKTNPPKFAQLTYDDIIDELEDDDDWEDDFWEDDEEDFDDDDF